MILDVPPAAIMLSRLGGMPDADDERSPSVPPLLPFERTSFGPAKWPRPSCDEPKKDAVAGATACAGRPTDSR